MESQPKPDDHTNLAYLCIDHLVAEPVSTIERHYNGQILALQERLAAISPEAHAIYEEIDLLIAQEKLAIQRACFLAGASPWVHTPFPVT